MSIQPRRVAVLTLLALLPVTAMAAAATGADGGLCASLLSMFACSGGCPN